MYVVRYMVGYILNSRLTVLIILYIFESLRNYTETQATPTFKDIQPSEMYCAEFIFCISRERSACKNCDVRFKFILKHFVG